MDFTNKVVTSRPKLSGSLGSLAFLGWYVNAFAFFGIFSESLMRSFNWSPLHKCFFCYAPTFNFAFKGILEREASKNQASTGRRGDCVLYIYYTEVSSYAYAPKN